MYFQYSDIVLNVNTVINEPGNAKSLFLIHGFTGSADDWRTIAPHIYNNYNIYMIDLIGHGRSESPSETFLYTQHSIIDQLDEIIHTINSSVNVLAGYSMGGRAALCFGIKRQDLLSGLILESTSPGIQDEDLREERLIADERLADFISEHSLGEFVDYWMNLDIFNTQRRFSAEKLISLKDKKLDNNKTGLINSLKGFGTGAMTPLFNDLKDLKTKTLLITGELDRKFTALNTEMKSELPFACHEVIKNAGHNTHLEEPKQFISAVNKFLKEL